MKRTDRDRVLMNIAVATSGNQFDTMERFSSGWQMRFSWGNPSPQFLATRFCMYLGMPLTKGDIVRCSTNPNHHWGIAEMVEYHEGEVSLLREIGGSRLCRMGNESFDVLRFMPEHLLLTGKKKQLYDWAHKAFSERYNEDYLRRCGGVQFDGELMHIWSRPHIWAQHPDKDGNVAQPRRFSLPWSKRTRLKDIISAMKDQGFDKPFKRGPNEPVEGMGRCARLTKESLEDALAKYVEICE